MKGRFSTNEFDLPTQDNVGKLTSATIQLWKMMKSKMLPTPSKFHYVFNMRDLSRIFQGILLTPKESIRSGGLMQERGQIKNFESSKMLIGLWKHECDRVFCDKPTTDIDKAAYEDFISEIGSNTFGENTFHEVCSNPKNTVSFLRDDTYDEDGAMTEEAPNVYEDGGSLESIRERSYMFLKKYNAEHPSKKMDLILFEDALKHLIRISRLLETPRGSGLLVGVGFV